MQRHRSSALAVAAAALALCAVSAYAQSERKAVLRYEQMIEEGSPVELFELEGEALWKKQQGPKQASLEQCDLGMGPGVVKGAYVHLPRYFKDTGRVQDLESRLVTCMMTLQGRSHKDATHRTFGNADKPSEMEYLVAYVVGQSRGIPIDVSVSNPKAKAAYELGRKIFFYRAGPWDFSCASCHGVANKRIRMQALPVLSEPSGARGSYATWPAYRVSNSQMKTMQWRINDCFRQMRFPEPTYASDATIALSMFLAVTANGEPYRGPGTKR